MRKLEKSRGKRKKPEREARTAAAASIRDARRALGISKKELAQLAGVDDSTVGGWERGRFLPRDGSKRLMLAKALKMDIGELSRAIDGAARSSESVARLVEPLDEFPTLLVKLLGQTKTRVKDLRLAAPYVLPPFIQVEFRKAISARILDGSVEVQRVEIFYSLERLREVLANILRYDGRKYFVRSFCPGLKEVAPALGGYAFDDASIILGGYFSSVPPHGRSGLFIQGEAAGQFFSAYWDEVWRRGTPLNLGGAADLSALRAVAITLGLRESAWPSFVEEAQALRSADGAPFRI